MKIGVKLVLPMPTLCTIGYEGADLDAFIATLQAAGVTLLIDIRDAPVSRRPGFSKNALAEALTGAGIGYRHVKALGNPKPGRDAARAGDLQTYHRIFSAQLATDDAVAALAVVVETAKTETPCLMCYERDPAQCHRSLVVAALPQAAEIEIRHLKVSARIDPRQGTLDL